MVDYRKNDRYYGSDLNKFIDENCTHEMTSINIDCIQYRRSKNKLRIIESKHTNERPMKKGQKELLQLLARIFKYLNKIQNKLSFEICIVRGNDPYQNIEVINLINNKKFNIYGYEKIIKWLQFDYYLGE